MANAAEIQTVLSQMNPGQRVRLQLRDGSELSGTVTDGAGDELPVELEDADADVSADVVETVLMDVSTSGPE